MSHPDDYDDTIRHTPGAFALMAAVFEHAMLDAADPRYRLSALRWLLSEGAVWAVEYGGADPAAYRERIRSIKVTKPAVVWVDDDHYLGPLCRRGHEYQDTGQTLRRQYKESNYCPECDRVTSQREHKRRQARRREALERHKPSEADLAPNTYLGSICKRGHGYQGGQFSVRYRLNNTCIECYRESRAEKRRKQQEDMTGPRGAPTYVGPLCNRQHRYKGQDASLRYTRSGTSGGNCVECSRTRRRRAAARQLEAAS